ncbi:hypothetical protein GT347_06085 [Xylophilus rhododendri]|uniref:Uncharacterized protein n=1 Tax=Xylophilus rhododendri TaxID=2697032 RepID=A0A857J406_9BURK|nr:hypothetical protein [Xylophilus rhododendri]QHI97595.1 hypothetical protein GT347_06085 [Xylophilus rhododendri]
MPTIPTDAFKFVGKASPGKFNMCIWETGAVEIDVVGLQSFDYYVGGPQSQPAPEMHTLGGRAVLHGLGTQVFSPPYTGRLSIRLYATPKRPNTVQLQNFIADAWTTPS